MGLEERRRNFDEAAPERFPYHRQAPAPCLHLVCLVPQSEDAQPNIGLHWHRRLHAAAKAGEAGTAEAVLSEMTAIGLSPGPRAYHALAVAYAKAGDAHAALSAVQRAARELGAAQRVRWRLECCWACCGKRWLAA